MSGNLVGYLWRCGRDVSRFRRTSEASTAVEFALVFPGFAAMLIAILEVCYFLFAQQTLQTAASEMGRMFMTNQAPSQSSTINQVNGSYNGTLNASSTVCNIIKPLLSCSSVIVNVQAYQDWESANTSMQSSYQLNSSNQCVASTGWNYNAGNPGQVVVIQLIYPLNIVTGPLGFALKSNCNGNMDVMGVTVIRVEPS